MRGSIVYGPKGVKLFYIDGAEVDAETFHAAFPSRIKDLLRTGQVPGGTQTGGWPLRSEALAVHPNQIEKANARNQKHGIATRYEPGTGIAVIPDRGDRKKLLRLEGVVDRNSFTGN